MTRPPRGAGEAALAPACFGVGEGKWPILPLEAATTRGDALARLRRSFLAAGLDTPDLDARVLLCAALGIDAAALAAGPETPVGAEAAARVAAFAGRRLAREPVARILGVREFWGLAFELAPETLEPRPDTEAVVEAALGVAPDRRTPLRILDLGTGSGCLLLALLHELPISTGVGVDRSPGAVAAARQNASRLRVGRRAAFLVGDWAAAIAGCFDLVVSNPPYIRSADLARLEPEVRDHDPAAALDGGPDGLDAYRRILAQARDLLRPQGTLVLEIGADQQASVAAIAARAHLEPVRVVNDLGGRPRAMALKPKHC